WRTIEAGIRIKNWVKALDILLESGKVEVEILFKILISINEHIEYLNENNKYERIQSNWVILEQQGVFISLNFFPELKISKELKESNLETLEEAIKLQVVEDGLHWEQSFQYHNEMLNCYLEILCLAEKNNIEISSGIKDKVYEMLRATLYIKKPNHCQSNYGDSDEEDLREILTLGALIFKEGLFKNYGYEYVDFNSLMLYGEEAIEEYKNLEVKKVHKVSKAFEDSGLYYMRTGFSEKDSYSMFKCGFLGSGHGHSDTMHLEISYKGEDVLVDSGRYTYSQSDEIRIELKKPKSHNTTTIDGEDFTICTSSWSNNGVATPIKGFNKFTNEYDFVEGGHLGYINTKGMFCNRKVIFIKPGIWVVSDEFFGNGEHNYEQFYNFNSKSVEKIRENKVKYTGDNIDFHIETLCEEGKFEIEESKVSKDYNKLYKSSRAIFKRKGMDNTFINCVMYGKEKNSEEVKSINYVDINDWQGKKISSDVAEAIEIIINDNEKYIVLLVHREDPKGRKMYLVNNHRIYGRVAVIHEKGKKSKINVLAY
ncbi:MAG: alginate lyase family protein, partial [Clostridium sp.]